MGRFAQKVGFAGLMLASAFAPMKSRAEVFRYAMNPGESKKENYELLESSKYDGRDKDAGGEFSRTSRPFEEVPTMHVAEDGKKRETWHNSNNVSVQAAYTDEGFEFSYRDISGKRKEANVHLYFLFKDDLSFKCTQDLIVKRDGGVSYVPAIPEVETRRYSAADRVNSFLERVTKKNPLSKVPTSVGGLVKLALIEAKDTEDKNAYEKLIEKIPGNLGITTVCFMRAGEYIFAAEDGGRREELARLGEGYSIYKVPLLSNDSNSPADKNGQIGRRFRFEIGGEKFGDPAFFIAKRIGFEDRGLRSQNSSSLDNLAFELRRDDPKVLEAFRNVDGLKGTYWSVEDEESSGAIISFNDNLDFFSESIYRSKFLRGKLSIGKNKSDIPVIYFGPIVENGEAYSSSGKEFIGLELGGKDSLRAFSCRKVDGRIVGESDEVDLVRAYDLEGRKSPRGGLGVEFRRSKYYDPEMFEMISEASCTMDLRLIREAKRVSKSDLEKDGKIAEGPVSLDDLVQYIKGGKLPANCLSEGVYDFGDYSDSPSCSVHGVLLR
jgi:hypothetical protein